MRIKIINSSITHVIFKTSSRCLRDTLRAQNTYAIRGRVPGKRIDV
jgi:hypothetical protein